jgi:hypothetical protein
VTELDLVPQSYRRTLALKQGLYRFLSAYAALILVIVIAKFGLTFRLDKMQHEIGKLQAAKQVMHNQAARSDELKVRKEAADQRLALLTGLQGGVSAEAVLHALDQAVDESIWFQQVKFQREGQVVPHQPESAENGYFVILAGDGQAPQQEAWRLRTHLEIRGQARDHSALSRFIQRLTVQPEVEEARLINADLHPYASTEVVDFNVAVVINNRPDRR